MTVNTNNQSIKTNSETQPQNDQKPLENQPKIETKEESPPIKTEENQVNWKRFREEKERDRKARIEAEKEAEKRKEEAEALKQAMEALLNKPQSQPQYEQEETEELRIERKVKETLDRERQKQLQEQQKQQVQDSIHHLKNTYRDFDLVCSSENLDYLEYHHPKLAKRLSLIPDGYDKWEAIYDEVKDKVPYANKKEDDKRIEKNLQKPQANMPNLTDTKPTGSPWKLSEDRRMENWRRMQKDIKNM